MAEALVLKGLSVPKGVEIVSKKSATIFFRGEKKAVLKGHALEITNPIKTLGDRVKVYSAKVIESCHLGSIKAVVPGIQNTVDLQKIINKYFKA